MSIGAGLLWYGQNYLIYPSAFPPGSRTGASVIWAILNSDTQQAVDVPTPDGLPYEDLALETSDKITLRCYLIPQKKDLASVHAAHIDDNNAQTDDEWDSAFKVSLIPTSTPILMLSGAKDDLVPKEHMRSLWEALARRGEAKTSGGKEYKVGLEHAKFMEFPDGGHSKRRTLVQSIDTINLF
ncbi:hypothetical protein DXG01_005390 [Tephrocybe rancida]|nr:hypothetical protein DXG01_005390 [Tephrocybe rancida]